VTPESTTSGGLGAALIAFAAYFQANAWWIIPVGIVAIIAIVVAIHYANKPKQFSPKTE
jgi:1,4-dihydroxy-2-naphthoate octaprenyltransferase